MENFKPQLLDNDKAGVTIDWESRIENPLEWLMSDKKDGGRVEITEDGYGKSREMKIIPNIFIQDMAAKFADQKRFVGIMEAEFWAPGMNFSEIMHFFKASDVTSQKSKKKWQNEWNKTKQGTSFYMKTVKGVPTKQYWEYPGRTPEWMTTWHPELQFQVFDHCIGMNEDRTKLERYLSLVAQNINYYDNVQLIKQYEVPNLDFVFDNYQRSIDNGGEGLVLIKKDSLYKFGRKRLAAGDAFKVKESNVEFEGVILSVEEATEAREGAEKTITLLGRSKTSQLKEDRVPSGLAKGFKVRMVDGNELTVSLNGFNHADRRYLLDNPERYVGKEIVFTGMKPTKHGGCPRHAHYTNPS
jgi:hypothetical protein